MALPVVYRRKVGQDLGAAFGYYEGQSKGLGERFFGAVVSSLEAVERYPEIFARVHGRVEIMKESARYAKIVEWSEEDQCYVGGSPGLVYGGCHGADETEVFAERCLR